MKMLRKYHLEDITPWEHEEPTLKMLSYFQEPEKPLSRSPHLPDLARRRVASQNRNLRTLPKQNRKSMREINIQFPPPSQATLSHHSFDSALQDVTLREGRNSRHRKRESTYILKQKFATIRRSMILMGENKENAVKSTRYEL